MTATLRVYFSGTVMSKGLPQCKKLQRGVTLYSPLMHYFDVFQRQNRNQPRTVVFVPRLPSAPCPTPLRPVIIAS